jgi:hypothetical protein
MQELNAIFNNSFFNNCRLVKGINCNVFVSGGFMVV